MPHVEVSDPFGVVDDSKMPFLKDALDPVQASRELARCLAETRSMDTRLSAIRVCRYKPGRRCLVEYQLQSKHRGPVTLLGKARAKGTDHTTWAVVTSLRDVGFGSDAADGISIPEPVGTIPAFHMWLQFKVEGEPFPCFLRRPGAEALAVRVADAAHKLHATPIQTGRRHTVTDELSILSSRLDKVKDLKPEWAGRLDHLGTGCTHLARSLPLSSVKGIHRDFYPEHVIISGTRLWLVDFDLYCQGDPALDIGNFVAHVMESSLRAYSDPAALRHVEQALSDRFVERHGRQIRDSIAVYTTLSLARLIHISTLFPERQASTERLLALCEARLRLNPSRA